MTLTDEVKLEAIMDIVHNYSDTDSTDLTDAKGLEQD